MKYTMYEAMYQLERTQFYFRAKREIVLAVLEQYLGQRSDMKIADFGCGCGLMLTYLSRWGTVTGYDYNEEALLYCRKNFSGDLIQMDLQNSEPLKTDLYDGAIALDIIEHIEDERTAVANIYHSLKEQAVCIFTVPAFHFLWSYHDENCMHKRRYTKESLFHTISQVGFEAEYISYYDFWLFPIVYVIRKLSNIFHINKNSELENGFQHGVINWLLYKVMSSEIKRITKGKKFPFGVSIICVARKGKKYE